MRRGGAESSGLILGAVHQTLLHGVSLFGIRERVDQRGFVVQTEPQRTILCCGDRVWRDWDPIWRELRALGPCLIVHGDARGADKMCGYVARRLGYAIDPNPAQWNQYGKAAGPIRNRAMLIKHPHIAHVLAFHADLAHSKGTKDMVEQAEAKGIPVTVIAR